jgi:hypothetical protein
MQHLPLVNVDLEAGKDPVDHPQCIDHIRREDRVADFIASGPGLCQGLDAILDGLRLL